MPYKVQDFFRKYQNKLDLRLTAGKNGLHRKITKPEVHRPGLSLSGYRKNMVTARIIVFGKVEIEYIKELDPKILRDRINLVITKRTPSIIIARKLLPPKILSSLCEEYSIPLFRSSLGATNLLSKITYHLLEEFAPSLTLHGTLVEVFGVGILIQGDSSVGKSEAALGLIERGHRLISDDVVRVKKKEGSYLEGSGPELTRHLMEIRGIGIINVAHLYGAVCVRPDKKVDLAIKLEQWDDTHFYDRVGLEERFCEILGVSIPFHILPVKPGRDVVLLIETFALNYRLKEMGYHSAKEFNTQLLDAIAKRKQIRDSCRQTLKKE